MLLLCLLCSAHLKKRVPVVRRCLNAPFNLSSETHCIRGWDDGGEGSNARKGDEGEDAVDLARAGDDALY